MVGCGGENADNRGCGRPMSVIVVMDIGKTNAKLCVVDAQSGALVSSTGTQTQSVDAAPYPHLDTESMWQWYVESLKDLQQTSSIETIVVTAHGATAALIDDDGLVLPVMDYEFAGVDELCDEYDARCDPFEHTYSPKLPLGLNVGRQLYWQRKNCNPRFRQARYVLPYAQYWSWLLTGVAVSEVSTIGSHTDLWNPLDGRYSDFAVREGFADLFPERRFAGDVLGSLRPEVREATGIDEGCQVLVGIHDSNASLVPWISTRKPPFTVMSTGTWVIIFSLGTPLQGLRAERDCTANVTIHAEPVACSRFMGGREYSAIAGDTPAEVGVADLLRIIDEKIVALPAFAKGGGPFPGMQGQILADRELSNVERHALATLYCALVSDESLGGSNSRGDIIVEGAYAKNPLLLQCLAIFREQQTVYASADSTGTTMGAAMLATDSVAAPALQKVAAGDKALRKKLLAYRQYWQQQVSAQQRQAEPA